jgi:catechol 2,3-dioxygenase-like lactoylglutathione lyase family enzyme
MPGCVLRAAGDRFDVDAFLSACLWKPVKIYRKGEAGRPRSRGPSTESGFNLVISDHETIARQTEDALAFLAANEAEIRRLVAAAGPDGVVLDFGTEFRDVAVQQERFTGALVRAAGALGLALEITLYPVAAETKEPDAPVV